MPKGHTNNPAGKPKGAKSKPEFALLKTYTHSWLLSLGQEGFNKLANKHPIEALKIAASFVPKEISADTDDGPVTISVSFQKA